MTAFPTMVLAAGLGIRLRPLTDVRPKALVPVGDRPLLSSVLERASAFSPRIAVNAHHHAAELRTFLDAHHPEVELSHEAELLGTAGGLRQADAFLGGDGPVVVWNGDIVADIDLFALAAAHTTSPGRLATLVVQPRPPGQGNVGLDAGGRIVRLRDRLARASGAEHSGGDFVPVHVLGAALRATLPLRGCLVGDVYIPALTRGEVLGAFINDAPFFDVGSPGLYLAANLAWLDQRRLAHWADVTARVATCVTLERSLVGPGAEVAGAGALERCVVWPGARAVAPLADAVVLAAGRVVHVGAPLPC